MRSPQPKAKRPSRPTSSLERKPEGYCLKLFIAGMSARSLAAIRSIQRICDRQLGANYQLEIVDLYRQPGRARGEQIVALPTLIKEKPLPARRFIGTLADEARVLRGLDVKNK